MRLKNKQIITAILLGSLIFITLSFFVFFPAWYLTQIAPDANYLIDAAKQLLLFIAILFFASIFRKQKIVNLTLAILTGAYYTLIYLIIAYRWYTNAVLNPYFFIDSYDVIIETGINLFGVEMLIMIAVTFALFFIILSIFFTILFKNFNEYKEKYLTHKLLKEHYIVIFTLIILPIFPANSGYLTYHYKIIKDYEDARDYFQTLTNKEVLNTDLTTAKFDENIFMLQLESGNSLVLNGQSEMDGQKYNDIYIPNLYQISQDGILLPYFWSNNMQTIRAQENIICGIANNIKPLFSLKPEQAKKLCLPQILKQMGYKAIAFRADNLAYQNMGGFMQYLGYDEIHNDDIMQSSDKKYDWGYDDCIFYKRAFEYLKKNYPEPQKLFIYFEVSTNHLPFEGEEEYEFTHKFEQPQNFEERYINSSLEQDYCLANFYQEYGNYAGDKSNLVILSDTSWPVGLNDGNLFNFTSAYNENFLTFLAYIPPRYKKDNFQTGKIINDKKIYAHSDILPTIMQLITGTVYQNSFAFELLKKPPEQKYENCQILTQPYSGGQIVIIQDKNKYVYHLTEQTLTLYDLEDDLMEKNPQILQEKMSLHDFQSQYFCQRFK